MMLLKQMLFVIVLASFMLFGVQISLFWWRYLYYDVVKKALFVTYLNTVYYDVIKAGYICYNFAEATLLVVVLLKRYFSLITLLTQLVLVLK